MFGSNQTVLELSAGWKMSPEHEELRSQHAEEMVGCKLVKQTHFASRSRNQELKIVGSKHWKMFLAN